MVEIVKEMVEITKEIQNSKAKAGNRLSPLLKKIKLELENALGGGYKVELNKRIKTIMFDNVSYNIVIHKNEKLCAVIECKYTENSVSKNIRNTSQVMLGKGLDADTSSLGSLIRADIQLMSDHDRTADRYIQDSWVDPSRNAMNLSYIPGMPTFSSLTVISDETLDVVYPATLSLQNISYLKKFTLDYVLNEVIFKLSQLDE